MVEPFATSAEGGAVAAAVGEVAERLEVGPHREVDDELRVVEDVDVGRRSFVVVGEAPHEAGAGIGTYAAAEGGPPARLADVARHVGVSTATAYRHFASLEDLANAHMARLPEHAVEAFERRRVGTETPDEAFARWNRAWVRACLEYGATAIPLRSAAGFLRRRADGDPLVSYVCAHVEPLLAACDVPVEAGVTVWNAVSDPREVVDLRATLGYGERRIADLVTAVTLSLRE